VLPGWYRALRRPALIRLAHRLPTERLSSLRSFVRNRVSKPVQRPEPADETLNQLREVFTAEMTDLRGMTGLDFAGWSV